MTETDKEFVKRETKYGKSFEVYKQRAITGKSFYIVDIPKGFGIEGRVEFKSLPALISFFSLLNEVKSKKLK